MPGQTAHRPPILLAAAICLVLVIALGASSYDQYFRTPMLETGDIAVNALQVDNAKHFRELYGNYSRFEFNHPGPAFFYAYAAGEWLLHDLLHVVPSPGNAHLLTSMFVQSCFFSLALALIAAHVPGRLWLGLAALGAAVHFGPLQSPFMSIWPPHVLLMPFLCFVVACCSLACGRVNHLPWVMLAGGFLFHGHVAQPLFVGGLGGLSVVLAARQLRRDHPGDSWRQHARRERRWLWVAGGLAVLFALPLVIDVLTGGTRSNVATIIGRFRVNTTDTKSFIQSFLYFLSFATPAQNQEDVFTQMGPAVAQFFREHWVRITLWLAVLGLGPGFALVRSARVPAETRRFLLMAHLFLAVTVPLCVLWGVAQAGPMMNFNSYFYYGIYFLGLVLVLCWIDSLAPLPEAQVPAVTAALCAIAAIVATWEFRMPRWSEQDVSLGIKQAVDTALAAGSRGPHLLTFEHAHWPKVASVALELQRQGVRFHMAPWWGFMFGHQHSLTRLGEKPEDAATIWWITETRHGDGGLPLNESLSLFTRPARLNPDGGGVSFEGGANGFRYVVSGLSAGNLEYAQTELPRMVVVFEPGPADRDVQLSLEIGTNGPRPQAGTVYFNERELATLTANEHATHSVVIPRDLWNSRPRAKLEFRFPEAVYHNNYDRPRHDWWSAWSFWAIRTRLAP